MPSQHVSPLMHHVWGLPDQTQFHHNKRLLMRMARHVVPPATSVRWGGWGWSNAKPRRMAGSCRNCRSPEISFRLGEGLLLSMQRFLVLPVALFVALTILALGPDSIV